MPEIIKEQRKALKITITSAISAALSKNKHLSDKKVQKAIKNAASEIAKKITKAAEPKTPNASSTSTKKTSSASAKKVVKKKTTSVAKKKPAVKKTTAKPAVKK